MSYLLAALGLMSMLCCSTRAETNECIRATSVRPGSTYVVQAKSIVRRRIEPHFFGFNIVWIGFQDDWVAANGEVAQPVVDAMSAFPGAVYRYPGGTVANYFDWRTTVGTRQSRAPQKAADWKEPEAVRFGFQEYLDFVRKVKGQAWLVANLYGDFVREQPIEPLAASARAWADVAKKTDAAILRWELGNELDRDHFQWPPDKYVARATTIATAIRQSDPEARFVGLLEDYDAQKWISAKQYDGKVAAGLSSSTGEYALHLYYDGKPGGPPIPHRYRHLCESVEAAEKGNGRSAKIWITEHARWPPEFGTPHWKQNWPKTQDLSGAIAVADMVIAASQSPAVEGLFLHSLSGSHGPWPLFHQTEDGLKPSVVYWALRILRDSMLEHVLQTETLSRNASEYLGGYDLRTSVLANADRSRFAVWAINRAPESLTFKLKLPLASNRSMKAQLSTLTSANLTASNLTKGAQLVPSSREVSLLFDDQGYASVSLPGNSVSALSIHR